MKRLGPLLVAGGAMSFLPMGLLLLLMMGPQQADCQTPSNVTSGRDGPDVIVGDSLTAGADAAFRQRFPHATVKAVGGMPWSWGVDQLRTVAPASGQRVAFLMGTNGGVTAAQVEALLQAFPNVSFVLMTVSAPRPYMTSTNAVIMAAAAQHRDRIVVADWDARVKDEPGLLGADRLHPASAAGVNAFVDTVARVSSAQGSARLVANVRPAGSHPPPWSQAEMEAAVRRYDPAQAHVLGAIAMAETGGKQFPTMNSTGEYHGPWAFQVASNAPRGVDMHRLDVDLDYAAKAAADLARTGINHQRWEVWPVMAAKFMRGGLASGQTGQSEPPQSQTDCLSMVSFTGASVRGPGSGMTGNWAPGIYPVVKMLADRFHVTAMTYGGHHPDEGHAVDLAVGQFGFDSADGAPGRPGTGPQWQIAQWIAKNLVDKGLAWYVVHHASIYNRERGDRDWRAMSLSGDGTQDHMDHIHVSFPPWMGNVGGSQVSSFPPAGNFSAPPVWEVPAMPAKL